MDIREACADAVLDLKDGLDPLPCSLFILARDSSVLCSMIESTAPVRDESGRRVLPVPRADRRAIEIALTIMHAHTVDATDPEELRAAVKAAGFLGADTVKERALQSLVTRHPFPEIRPVVVDALECAATRQAALNKLIDHDPRWHSVSGVIRRVRLNSAVIEPIVARLCCTFPISTVIQLALHKIPIEATDADVLRILTAREVLSGAHPAELRAIVRAVRGELEPTSPTTQIFDNLAAVFSDCKIGGGNVYGSVVEFDGEPSVGVHVSTTRTALPERFMYRLPWLRLETDTSTGYLHGSIKLLKLDKTLVNVRHVQMRVMRLSGCDVLDESWYGWEHIEPSQTLFTYEASWTHNIMRALEPIFTVTAMRVDVFYSSEKPLFTQPQFV